jgi:hypothetical protein
LSLQFSLFREEPSNSPLLLNKDKNNKIGRLDSVKEYKTKQNKTIERKQ